MTNAIISLFEHKTSIENGELLKSDFNIFIEIKIKELSEDERNELGLCII